MPQKSSSHTSDAPLFLADHGALDFINTVAQVDGAAHDSWQGDEDVQAWLHAARLPLQPPALTAQPGELLREARALRETIRRLVEQKKAGEAVDAAALNRYLAQANSYQQLVRNQQGALQLRRIYGAETPLQLLAPVAELAATLLTDEAFDRVRECEHPQCTLWFYDRTKAHRRRWCSMALCGNRAKVARFRQQK